MGGLYFSAEPPANFAQANAQDLPRFRRFYHRMLDAGVYLPPSPVEAFFFSGAHTEDDVAFTIDAVRRSLAGLD